VILEWPDLTVRARDGSYASGVRAAIYRTEASGAIHKLVERVVPAAGTIAGDVAYTDAGAVADIDLGEVLYTEGGVLSAFSPPSFRDLTLHKDRFFAINAERPGEIWYTKSFQALISPEFNPALKIDVPRGDATALATVDDKVVIFDKDSVYIVFGDGPSNTGLQNTFSKPQRISSDVGCIDPNSVATGSFGVVFQSKRGMYVIGRDLKIRYIGAAVDDTLSGDVTIEAATAVDDNHEVRFLVGTTMVVWNFLTNQWYTWTGLPTTKTAVIYNGDHCIGLESGPPIREKATVTDTFTGATNPNIKIGTGWIDMAGTQGYQRVKRFLFLCTASGNVNVTVKVFRDYEAAASFTKAFVASQVTGGQFGLHNERQKSQAFSLLLEVSGIPSGGTLDLSAITVLLGLKKGTFKLDPGKRQ
jgi:hypothetical protein